MSRHSVSLLVASAVIAGVASGARADYDARDVVSTQRGVVAHSSYGACVRTKWDKGDDACAPKPAPKPVVQAPPPRKVITKEERTVYFDFNKTELTPAAKAKLDTLSEALKTDGNIKDARVFGYADRIGSASYNKQISRKRAENVRDYIISRGYTNANVTETRWFGKSNPSADCPESMKKRALVECLQKDRRVEVEIDYLSEEKAPEQR